MTKGITSKPANPTKPLKKSTLVTNPIASVPMAATRLTKMAIPAVMNFQDKKPWEIEMIDTLQLWKFGDFKNFTSLETLTTIFQIPSPKSDIDGSQVGKVYWEEKDLIRIVRYCQNDVVAMIQLYRRLNQLPMVDTDKILVLTP